MPVPRKSPPRPRFEPRWFAILAAIFAVALAIRLYGVFQFGFGYDGPDSFLVINYDEAGGCRALLGGRKYNTFVGYQILFIQKLMGEGPQPEHEGEGNWRKFCHSRASLVVHRVYSAVTGALTVVLLGVLALLMWPDRPQIAWTACALLGLSNMHVAHSHFGTVDAPQLFFIGLLTVALGYAIVFERRWPLWISPLLLIAAIWTKSNVFTVFAFVPMLPDLKLGKYWKEYTMALVGLFFLWSLIGGQETIVSVVNQRSGLLWGGETSRFGTGYGHIGTWRRWIRNGINLPVVHIVGISLPAFLAAVYGLKKAFKTRSEKPAEWRLWLLQTPAVGYFFYMLLIAPPTYYRYYLPLFPTVALLAAYGFWESRWASNKVLVALFLLYPALLTLDSEYNYANDPRNKVASWLDSTPNGRKTKIMATYYSGLPYGVRFIPFSYMPQVASDALDKYKIHGADFLKTAEYLILNESWYDTAFSSELNGPFGWNPEWAIKTTPLAARTYRRILAGEEPALELERAITLKHFTPEMLVHRWCYGSFPMFVSDLMIYRVK
ncbi:MAG: hypothetical protein IH898_13135 [Planctomycetes bacterium]|nr:hypothetical protein [Planctomycetota bacterium]